MTFVLLLPPAISLLLLSAHFFRVGRYGACVAMLVLIGLLFVRRRFVIRTTQVVLVLGSVVWLHTLFLIRQARLHEGLPVGRLTVILMSVAVFTLLSGLVFVSTRVRARYGVDAATRPGA